MKLELKRILGLVKIEISIKIGDAPQTKLGFRLPHENDENGK